MSNFSNGQQQRTASPNPTGQKEALSVAGCALGCNWRSTVVSDGAKVTVSSKNNALHKPKVTMVTTINELQKAKVRMSDESTSYDKSEVDQRLTKVTASDKSMSYDTASAQGFFGVKCELIEAAISAAFRHAKGVTLSPGAGGDAINFVMTLSASNSARLTSRPLKLLFSLDCAEMEQLANSLINLNSGKSPGLVEHEQYSGSIEHHSAEFLAQFDHNGNRDASTAGEIITNPNTKQPLRAGRMFTNVGVHTAFPVGRMITFDKVLATVIAGDRRWRSTPTQQNNSLKNEVGHSGGKAGNSANEKSAGFCGCLLVEIRNGADQPKKKGQVSPALDMLMCCYHATEWHQILMSAGEWFLSQSFMAASMRVCQPRPVALKASITSGEYLMVADFLVGSADAGLPRRMVFLPSCRLAFSKNVSSSSGASSGSTQVLFKSFNFAFISFPHRDNAARLAALRPDHNNKPGIQFAYGDVSDFSVVLPVIIGGKVDPCENLSGSGEINTALQQCFFSFVLVVFNFHTIIVVTINKMSKGDLLLGHTKEKGQHSALTLWDGCFSSHEENQQSTVSGDGCSPDLAYGDSCGATLLYEQNQYLATQQDSHTEIIGGTYENFVGQSSDLALRRLSSPRATLTICRISSPAFVPISSTRASASSEDSRGFSSLPSTWRRAISPRTAVTMNCAFVSSAFSAPSMSFTTSWGKRALSCCDLLLVELVDILRPRLIGGIQYNTKMNTAKGLYCDSLLSNVNLLISECAIHQNKHFKNSKAQQVIATPAGLLTTTVSVDNEAAMKNSTTHPQGRDLHTLNKFTWRFLALSATDSNVIDIIAPTEREAREQSPIACVMVFAGRLPVQEVRHV